MSGQSVAILNNLSAFTRVVFFLQMFPFGMFVGLIVSITSGYFNVAGAVLAGILAGAVLSVLIMLVANLWQ